VRKIPFARANRSSVRLLLSERAADAGTWVSSTKDSLL
jgi:hypothetical protein